MIGKINVLHFERRFKFKLEGRNSKGLLKLVLQNV